MSSQSYEQIDASLGYKQNPEISAGVCANAAILLVWGIKVKIEYHLEAESHVSRGIATVRWLGILWPVLCSRAECSLFWLKGPWEVGLDRSRVLGFFVDSLLSELWLSYVKWQTTSQFQIPCTLSKIHSFCISTFLLNIWIWNRYSIELIGYKK